MTSDETSSSPVHTLSRRSPRGRHCFSTCERVRACGPARARANRSRAATKRGAPNAAAAAAGRRRIAGRRETVPTDAARGSVAATGIRMGPDRTYLLGDVRVRVADRRDLGLEVLAHVQRLRRFLRALKTEQKVDAEMHVQQANAS